MPPPAVVLSRHAVPDSRANQVLVARHGADWWLAPAPEPFSRQMGTCRLLGDRKHRSRPHALRVGDFVRIGSVGLVVSEVRHSTSYRVILRHITPYTRGRLRFGSDRPGSSCQRYIILRHIVSYCVILRHKHVGDFGSDRPGVSCQRYVIVRHIRRAARVRRGGASVLQC